MALLMNGFAIESSGSHLSVAIAKKGRVVLERLIDPKWKHEVIFWKQLPRWLEKATLQINNLDFVATTQGPGRFTGIRLGLGICNSWALTNKIPIFAPIVHEILERGHLAKAARLDARSKMPKAATLVAFSGIIVLSQPSQKPNKPPLLKSFVSMEGLFKSKEIRSLQSLTFYAAQNLHETIFEQCQKHNITAVSTIPRAKTLLNWILQDPPPKSRWHYPPRLAPALYLKESWK